MCFSCPWLAGEKEVFTFFFFEGTQKFYVCSTQRYNDFSSMQTQPHTLLLLLLLLLLRRLCLCVCVSFLPLCCFYEWNDKFCVILLFSEHTCCFKSAGVHIALVLWVGVPIYIYIITTTTTIYTATTCTHLFSFNKKLYFVTWKIMFGELHYIRSHCTLICFFFSDALYLALLMFVRTLQLYFSTIYSRIWWHHNF